MKSKYRYAPLILLAAPFLMANSPAPWATTFEYNEISISEISQTGNDITFTLTNTGDKYISEGSTMAPVFGNFITENGAKHVNVVANFVDQIFTNQGLGPGQSARFTTHMGYNINAENIRGFESYALEERDTNVEFSNVTFTKTGDKVYSLVSDVTGLGDYYYTVVVDVTYDGNDYCFGIVEDRVNNATVETMQELDLDKFEIKDIKAYRSMYNTYKGSYDNGQSSQSQDDIHLSPCIGANIEGNYHPGVYGKVAIDPSVPLTIGLVVGGSAVFVAAPIVIAIIISNKKRK